VLQSIMFITVLVYEQSTASNVEVLERSVKNRSNRESWRRQRAQIGFEGSWHARIIDKKRRKVVPIPPERYRSDRSF
jgi:hypothetical protein